MNKKAVLGSCLLSVLVFLVFFAYYSIGAYYLPSKAGPDYGGSRAAADFYLDKGRLATIPQDESIMKFSVYGNSRLLRPPAAFASAAMVAKVNKVSVDEGSKRFYYYRLANAIVGALTVAVIFATILLLFNSTYIATFGALLVGLLPQFAFTSMYLNDDSVAILAVSLIVLFMAWIVKSGLSTQKVIFFALAIGFTVLSKKSAWIFLPVAILFYLAFILRFNKDFFRHHLLMALTFILAGGWWLGFNMWHYGWDDPFLSELVLEVTARHVKIDLNQYGFLAEGVGMKKLLFGNHKEFIPATYVAVVGYLDWLKLRLGSIQYGFYLFLVFGVVANFAFLLSESILSKLKDRHVQFEWFLYLAIAAQIVAYTWVNVYRDIQIQGKYLLPVILPMLILGLSFYTKAFNASVQRRFSLSRFLLLCVVLLAPIIVHADALVNHVIPFYWPNLELGLLGEIFQLSAGL